MATSTMNMENNSTKNGNNTEMNQQLKDRAERNRQRAILLKKSKVVTHPYANSDSSNRRLLKVQGQRVIDSGGGFLLEENDDLEQQMLKIRTEPEPVLGKFNDCEECQQKFGDSYLLHTFNLSVCDECRRYEAFEREWLPEKIDGKNNFWILHHDNASSHTSRAQIVRHILTKT